LQTLHIGAAALAIPLIPMSKFLHPELAELESLLLRVRELAG
jgi:hypothetical protein